MRNAQQGNGEKPVIWLPLPPESFDDLPSGAEFVYWNGIDDYPADPAEASFYAPPLTTEIDVLLRPLRSMKRLRVLQALSAGVDHLVPLISPGTVLCNARGVHEASTAELALTLTLASLRGVPAFVRGQDAEVWQVQLRPTLVGMTVVIVGYGSVGAAIEDLLEPFGCRIARVARAERESPRGFVHAASALPDLLPKADVVILSVPLTRQTRGLVGAEFLAQMQDGALLVNVARGAVVDTEALLAQLRSGRLHAAMDVTDPEPLPAGHPLWTAPGTLISPHAGAFTSALLPRVRQLLSAQLHRFVRGEQLQNVVLGVGAGRG